jgi:hypothetical protein
LAAVSDLTLDGAPDGAQTRHLHPSQRARINRLPRFDERRLTDDLSLPAASPPMSGRVISHLDLLLRDKRVVEEENQGVMRLRAG